MDKVDLVNELNNRINQEIENILLPEFPQNLYEPIKYILTIGGKRLRPLLLLLSNKIFGGNIEDAINPAIGLEIFHNFTLLHDDIMDKAEIRRNKPTVHINWNENIAILSGDAMMIIANKYFTQTGSIHLKQVLDIFNNTALEVCEGQQYDMNFESRLDVTEEEYIEMIRLKTSVLIASAFKIGAVIAGANSEDADNIYNYGINIGLCFQLQDDFLDTFGDKNVFGKKIGGDIVANKKTFLLISALNLANDKTRKYLLELIQNKSILEEVKINEVKNIYNQLNIASLLKSKIDYYYLKAEKYLSAIKISEENKNYLTQYIEKLHTRNN